MDMLRDYRSRVFRARAELAVAEWIVPRLSNWKTASGEDIVETYAEEKVGLTRVLRARLLDEAAEVVGGSANELGEMWIP